MGYADVSGLRNITGSQINPATSELQTALNDLIGEVQVSPTTNTVLDRLKQIKGVLDNLDAEDYATETTLLALKNAFDAEDFATQTTLSGLLTAFNNEDFSSETTLAALKAAFDAEDFASQTTLAAIETFLNAEDFASETTLSAFKSAFDARDLATQTTLAALKTAFDNEDFASETTLASLKAAFDAEDFATAANQASTNTKLDTANTNLLGVRTVLDDVHDDPNNRLRVNDALTLSAVQSLETTLTTLSGGNRTTPAQQPPNLAAAQDWIAPQWENVKNDGSITIVFACIGGLSIAEIQWSDDGINFNGIASTIKEQDAGGGTFIYVIQTQAVYEYFRIHVTDSGSGSTFIANAASVQKVINAPSLSTLETQIGAFDVAPIVRSVFTGRSLDGLLQETANYKNVQTTSRGALKAAIPWEAVLKYSTPIDPALPSGPAVTIHPTLNTESNVIDSGWVPAREFPGGNFIHVLSQQAGLDIYLANASDINGNNAQGLDSPSAIAIPGAPVDVSAAFFDDFFRVIVTNTSGTQADDLTVRSMGLQAPPPPVSFSLNQDLPTFVPAPVIQTVIKGLDSVSGTYKGVAVDENGNIKVAPGARLSEGDGRSHVDAYIDGVTGSVQVYDVPAGHVFQMTSILLSAQNISLIIETEMRLRDGGVAGTVKIPFILPEATNQTIALLQQTISFPEPIPFSSDVYLELAGGVPKASMTVVGYIEPV